MTTVCHFVTAIDEENAKGPEHFCPGPFVKRVVRRMLKQTPMQRLS